MSWLGGLFASYVINAYELTLQNLVVLAVFFPVIIGMGGNAATQSLAVAVRGLATGAIEPSKFLYALLREGRVGLSLGVIYGVLLGAVAFVWQGTPMLGLPFWAACCRWFSPALASTRPWQADRFLPPRSISSGWPCTCLRLSCFCLREEKNAPPGRPRSRPSVALR